MRLIKEVKGASRNKACVGEVYKIDSIERTIIEISKKTVYFDEGKSYFKMEFDSLARQAKTLFYDKQDKEFLAKLGKRKLSRDNFFKPYAQCKRFVCGYVNRFDENGKISDKEFIMVFWNNYSKCPNSHGDLTEFYKEQTGEMFQAISGGFYDIERHNDARSQRVYLFGASQTYRGFFKEREQIEKFLKNLDFEVSYGFPDKIF